MKQDHKVQGGFQSAGGIYRKCQNEDSPFSLVPCSHITLVFDQSISPGGALLSGQEAVWLPPGHCGCWSPEFFPFTVLPPMGFSYQISVDHIS